MPFQITLIETDGAITVGVGRDMLSAYRKAFSRMLAALIAAEPYTNKTDHWYEGFCSCRDSIRFRPNVPRVTHSDATRRYHVEILRLEA